MNRHDPLPQNQPLPPEVESLAGHPEKARWHAAILLYNTSRRWPKWPYELALAVVDSRPAIHVAHFMVRPPAGWSENAREVLPSGISADLVLEKGLPAKQAVSVLNAILGEMEISTWGPTGHHGIRDSLAQGSGIKPSWHFGGAFLSGLDDDLRIHLVDNVQVRFLCTHNGDARLGLPPADISRRARDWARAYVTAGWAQRLLLTALHDDQLVSEVVQRGWNAAAR